MTCSNIDHWSAVTGFKWFSTTPKSNLGNDDPDFNNPVQGAILDCYLIAVLSSIAWIHDDTTNPAGQINTSITKNVYFYDGSTIFCIGPKATSTSCTEFIPISTDLPIDATGKPACAISSEYTSALKEIWPSFYEKAYARYRLRKGHINNWEYDHSKTPSYDDHPDIPKLPEGDPFATLTLLTNIPCIKYDMMYDPAHCPRDAGTIWTKLKSICQVATSNTNSQKIKYPAVAITNCTKDPTVPPTLTPPYPSCAAPAGSNVVYNDALLVANHSYSLLGIYTNPTTKKQYVILRNPCGDIWGFDSTSITYRLADDTLSFRVPSPTAYSFNWTLFKVVSGVKIPNCGVFAIQCEDFAQWFGAFGWIPL